MAVESKLEAKERIRRTLGEEAMQAFMAEYGEHKKSMNAFAAWRKIRENEVWFPRKEPRRGAAIYDREDWVIPSSWYPLVAHAGLEAEIEWVHSQRIFVIGERKGSGATKVHFERATEKPPSSGAVALMLTAASADLKFTEMLMKVKVGAVDEEESKNQKGERASLYEIEMILDKMGAVKLADSRAELRSMV
jgi:hypothetical protein